MYENIPLKGAALLILQLKIGCLAAKKSFIVIFDTKSILLSLGFVGVQGTFQCCLRTDTKFIFNNLLPRKTISSVLPRPSSGLVAIWPI